METGKIVQVMGPVVDVEFPPGNLPDTMTALKTTNAAIDDRDDNLIVEVALHLGVRLALHLLPALEQRDPSTQLVALVEEINPATGRVHASFNQTVAATGRLNPIWAATARIGSTST